MSLASRVRRLSGVPLILGATVVAGICGYAVTGLVAGVLGPARYSMFAVFWAALYLLVGALVGIQQEFTRAAHPVSTPQPSHRAWTFAVVGALTVFVAVFVTSLWWGPTVFKEASLASGTILAFGAACYVVVAVLSGLLYGLSLWRLIGLMIALDGVVRLLLIAVALATGANAYGLELAAILPFAVVPALLAPFTLRRTRRRYTLDVPASQLTWNAARTLVASASTAILVSGFPLLVGATSGAEPAASVGALILAITLTRAPLVVTFLALQSYFVVLFRGLLNEAGRLWARILVMSLGVVALTVVLSGLAWWLGEAVFVRIFGPGYAVDGAVLALLVAASGLVALLAISGSALLARGDHFAFAASWFLAAALTVVVMLTPLPLTERTILALTIGPAAGLALQFTVNVIALRPRRDASASRSDVRP